MGRPCKCCECTPVTVQCSLNEDDRIITIQIRNATKIDYAYYYIDEHDNKSDIDITLENGSADLQISLDDIIYNDVFYSMHIRASNQCSYDICHISCGGWYNCAVWLDGDLCGEEFTIYWVFILVGNGVASEFNENTIFLLNDIQVEANIELSPTIARGKLDITSCELDEIYELYLGGSICAKPTDKESCTLIVPCQARVNSYVLEISELPNELIYIEHFILTDSNCVKQPGGNLLTWIFDVSELNGLHIFNKCDFFNKVIATGTVNATNVTPFGTNNFIWDVDYIYLLATNSQNEIYYEIVADIKIPGSLPNQKWYYNLIDFNYKSSLFWIGESSYCRTYQDPINGDMIFNGGFISAGLQQHCSEYFDNENVGKWKVYYACL